MSINQQRPGPDYDQTVVEVRQLVADELHRNALDAIAALLDDASVALDTAQRGALLRLLTEIWIALDDGSTKIYTALTEALAAAAAAPDDPNAIFEAASQLVERHSPRLASALLTRAWHAHPTQWKLLHELVAALELQGRHAVAVALLREPAAQPDAGFLVRYLYAFNSILVDDVTTARQVTRALDPRGNDRHEFMVARLEDLLRRADFVGAITGDRERQFVHTGSLLISPPVVAELEETWGDYGANLAALRDVLRAIDRVPTRVVSFHGERKDTVARAAATIFDVPFAQQYLPDGEGLFITDNLAGHQADISAALRAHQPRQLYYAHFATTERELPVAADAIGTRAADAIIVPWDRWTRLDYTRADRPSGPPTESAEQLAAIMVEQATPRADLAALIAFARRAHDARLLALSRDRGSRERLWVWPVGG